jgi:uncharacterized protein YdhG (YjbR/CyaY superfamily)
MYKYHASHVIIEMCRLCANAIRKDNKEEAQRIAKLTSDIEELFPEAAKEINDIYGKGV